MGQIASKLCNENVLPFGKKEREDKRKSMIQYEAFQTIRRGSRRPQLNCKMAALYARDWTERPSMSNENIRKLYIFTEKLGQGNFGTVYLGYLKRDVEEYEHIQCLKTELEIGEDFEDEYIDSPLIIRKTLKKKKRKSKFSHNPEENVLSLSPKRKDKKSRRDSHKKRDSFSIFNNLQIEEHLSSFDFTNSSRSIKTKKKGKASKKCSIFAMANNKSRSSRTSIEELKPLKKFAIKSIKKKKQCAQLSMFLREIELMKSFDHPNIVNFYEVYEDKKELHLVMEYCGGGDLDSKLKEYGNFTEPKSKAYIFQILCAIAHLHNKNICHRDIKPENFLLKGGESNILKLTDFGLSQCFKTRKLKSIAGSPFYIAPEVLDQNYTQKCDLWSVGVMMYLFATGEHPFTGENNHAIFQNIFNIKYNTSLLKKSGYSKKAANLLKKLLVCEKSRYTAREALNHSWFKQEISRIREDSQQLLKSQMLQNLMEFSVNSTFQREIIGLTVQIFIDSPELITLTKIFQAYDSPSFNGILQKNQISKLFKDKKIEISDLQIESIIDSLYIKESGVVTYLEFLAGLLSRSFYTNRNNLKTLFGYLDTDDSGLVDFVDISKCFKRFGRNLGRNKIKRMITECEPSKDGMISYEEFKDIMEMEPERMDSFYQIEKKFCLKTQARRMDFLGLDSVELEKQLSSAKSC